jgi:hypothetical protein
MAGNIPAQWLLRPANTVAVEGVGGLSLSTIDDDWERPRNPGYEPKVPKRCGSSYSGSNADTRDYFIGSCFDIVDMNGHLLVTVVTGNAQFFAFVSF